MTTISIINVIFFAH